MAATAIATLGFAASASAATKTFEYTGAAQTWTVPAWVTEATFDLYGAQGGGDDRDIGAEFRPGLGGRATATIAVPPGDSIQVNVGGQGVWLEPDKDSGGFNGGGDSLGRGGGGGGGSDIRIGGTGLNDRVLVAGGGGGAGAQLCNDTPSVAGGGGGGDEGEPGDPGVPSCAPDSPGGGGTQTAGGAAGGGNAQPGTFGFGGDGDDFVGVGGAGGGGWWGGGAGYSDLGGGGGSGHGPAGTVFETGVRHGDGLVVVSFDGPMIAKQRVRDDLVAKQATAAKKNAKEIGKAIGHLEKSLRPDLWVDDAQLDPRKGRKVFEEERHAVESLLKVTPLPSVADEIGLLVEIDRWLASEAIDQAAGMPVNAKRRREVIRANEELAKGDAERYGGDPKKAIETYRKAWERAQKAIRAK